MLDLLNANLVTDISQAPSLGPHTAVLLLLAFVTISGPMILPTPAKAIVAVCRAGCKLIKHLAALARDKVLEWLLVSVLVVTARPWCENLLIAVVAAAQHLAR